MLSMGRREFLAGTAASLTSAGVQASPLGLPIGLQLYTISDALGRDFDGALKTVAAIGYRAVESSLRLGGHDALQLKQIFGALGLKWESAHCAGDELVGGLDMTIETAHWATLRYVVCAFPPIPHGFKQAIAGISGDDWRANAELFNKIGAAMKPAGIQFTYHNHNLEFRPLQGDAPLEATGYDILLARTDPDLVKFELDCGWMASAGLDPAEYLAKYPDRYVMLHIKDLTREGVPNTQLKMKSMAVGAGTVDWRRIFAAASKAKIKGYYVEQEPPFAGSSLDAAKASFDYLNRFNS
jgi:sugar phosphate isomerase/epimerase